MADKPEVKAPEPRQTETIPSVENARSAIASGNAPYIFFDEAPNFGSYNGICHVSLEAMRFNTTPSGVVADRVTVAHLRMNLQGAMALRAALDGALLIAVPKPEGAPN